MAHTTRLYQLEYVNDQLRKVDLRPYLAQPDEIDRSLASITSDDEGDLERMSSASYDDPTAFVLTPETADGGTLTRASAATYLDMPTGLLNIEPDVVNIGDLDTVLELEMGQYRLGDVGVTVEGLPPAFFRNAGDKHRPFVFEIAKDGVPFFHGRIEPDSIDYNYRTGRTAFTVLTWESMLGAVQTPARSVYEADVHHAADSGGVGRVSILWDEDEAAYMNDVVASVGQYVIEYDRVVGPDQKATTRVLVARAERAMVKKEDSLVLTFTLPHNITAERREAPLSVAVGSTPASPPTSTAYYMIETHDPLYAWIQAGISDEGIAVDYRVRDVDTGAVTDWRSVPFLRPETIGFATTRTGHVFHMIHNLTLGAVLPEFEVDLRYRVVQSVRGQSKISLIGKDFYGYVLPNFTPNVSAERVAEAILSLEVFSPLHAILNYVTFVGQSGLGGEFSRLVVPGEDPLEVIRTLQNTAGTFLRVVPYVDQDDLPRINVEFISRNHMAPDGDGVVQTGPQDVVEWKENPVEVEFDAVIIRTNDEVNVPPDYGDIVGVWFDGMDDMTPEQMRLTGMPQNALEIYVFDIPGYAPYLNDAGHEVILTGDGTEVVADRVLSLRAKAFFDFYRQFYRTFEAEYSGEYPDLIGTYATTDESSIRQSGLITSARTTLDITDPRTVVTGRIGQFLPKPPPPVPVARIEGPEVVFIPDGEIRSVPFTSLGSIALGDSVTYAWNLNDNEFGAAPSFEAEMIGSSVPTVNTLSLTITNESGSHTVQRQITVQPAMVVQPPPRPTIHDEVYVTASGERQVRVYAVGGGGAAAVNQVRFVRRGTEPDPANPPTHSSVATFVPEGYGGYWLIPVPQTFGGRTWVSYEVLFHDYAKHWGWRAVDFPPRPTPVILIERNLNWSQDQTAGMYWVPNNGWEARIYGVTPDDIFGVSTYFMIGLDQEWYSGTYVSGGDPPYWRLPLSSEHNPITISWRHGYGSTIHRYIVPVYMITPQELLLSGRAIQPDGYKSSDGSTGITQTITLNDGVFTFKNGILVSFAYN
jgi:hypothetical protein